MKYLIILLENIRYYSFWFKDFLTGSKIYKHTKEITFLLENDFSNKSKIIKEKSLKNLLSHAIETTPFYSTLCSLSELNDFPIINKNSINKNIVRFESITFNNKKLKTTSTSGSTGAPLKIKQDINKIKRNTADTIYFSKQNGFKIGQKLFYLRHWNTYYKKNKLISWFQNIAPVETLNLNKASITKLTNKLKKDLSTKHMLGHASAFERICEFLDKEKANPVNVKIKSSIAISEGLSNYTKQRMSHYFSTSIISRYSNMENGIIAQQKIDNNDFIINWASYYVEIFQLDNDIPAKDGELGRIIITDLFNYATPMIRYDTGDIGSIDYNCSPPVFKTIEGRRADVIYNTNGNIISSYIMINVYKYIGIKQSQLIQETKKSYTIKLNIAKEFKQEPEIIKEFKGYLGKDASIKIKYVNEIPLLASGKRKATINNYSKK